jgi:hypothetical protein
VERWLDTGLVFTSHLGVALDAGNVRKMFKRVCLTLTTEIVYRRKLRPASPQAPR